MNQKSIKMTGPIAWMAKNHVTANLLMIAFIFGGLLMSTRIKQEIFPDLQLDYVFISVPYPGASPEEVAAQALAFVKEGFDTVYLKVGFDEEGDLACVRAMREAVGPKPKIRIDANQAWSAGEAIRIIRRLDEFDLEFVDQPVLMYNLDALARVRAQEW